MEHLAWILAVVLVAGVVVAGVRRLDFIDERFRRIFEVITACGVTIFAVRELLHLAGY